jgi:hypothetical protein
VPWKIRANEKELRDGTIQRNSFSCPGSPSGPGEHSLSMDVSSKGLKNKTLLQPCQAIFKKKKSKPL